MAEEKMSKEEARELAKQRLQEYWKKNVQLIATLLVIWFVVAYIPPLFLNSLNEVVIFGFPLGYYIGSQGSLVVFVLLIYYYARRMNKLDEEYGLVGTDR